jgi:hypothetical protein
VGMTEETARKLLILDKSNDNKELVEDAVSTSLDVIGLELRFRFQSDSMKEGAKENGRCKCCARSTCVPTQP